jgi:5-(carboxyamino)imidazole ribonucleotide mutase
MPRGIPVATVGIGRADNAALLAVAMLAIADLDLRQRLESYREEVTAGAEAADRELQREL